MENIETLINQYTNLLNSKKEECTAKCSSLIADNRKDESNLEKIRINIYDIFTTLTEATYKQISSKKYDDENSKYEEFCQVYLQTFDKIPQNWMLKLEKAKKNNAVIDEVIEEVKLNTANDLKNIFKNLIQEV